MIVFLAVDIVFLIYCRAIRAFLYFSDLLYLIVPVNSTADVGDSLSLFSTFEDIDFFLFVCYLVSVHPERYCAGLLL